MLSRENHVYCYNAEEPGWTGCGKENRDRDKGRLSWLKRGCLSPDKRQNDRLDEAAKPSQWSKNHIKKDKSKNRLTPEGKNTSNPQEPS